MAFWCVSELYADETFDSFILCSLANAHTLYALWNEIQMERGYARILKWALFGKIFRRQKNTKTAFWCVCRLNEREWAKEIILLRTICRSCVFLLQYIIIKYLCSVWNLYFVDSSFVFRIKQHGYVSLSALSLLLLHLSEREYVYIEYNHLHFYVCYFHFYLIVCTEFWIYSMHIALFCHLNRSLFHFFVRFGFCFLFIEIELMWFCVRSVCVCNDWWQVAVKEIPL